MSAVPAAAMRVLATEAQLAQRWRVWGTGGWLPPGERAALDWVTLARTMGLGVETAALDSRSLAARAADGCRWIVLACDPEALPVETIEWLRARLAAEPVVVVGRAGASGLPWSDLAGAATTGDAVGGEHLRWLGDDARAWRCRKPFGADRLALAAGTAALADIDGGPIAAVRTVGRGRVVSLAFDASAARDAHGAATSLLEHLLIQTSLAPVAWIDLARAVALRIDDPGAAQNVHFRSWKYRQLDGDAWRMIGATLAAREARLSVAYVCGWVDDGDSTRGSLEVRGHPVAREAGRVHPSTDVVYRERAGSSTVVHDYASQYAALRALQARGSLDVELHGYTHMHPDHRDWARAADRYEALGWYRELGPAARPALAATARDAHPLAVGAAAVAHAFAAPASTLICPGDQCTNEALEVALDLGLQAVSSYYFALRHDDRFCWNQHVCAPYLDEADAAWFDSPLPVVGYFHDRDVALYGVEWLARALDAWRDAGARRFITLRELACAGATTLHWRRDGVLDVRCACASPPGGALPIRVRFPGKPQPQEIAVSRGDAVGGARRARRVTAALDGRFDVPFRSDDGSSTASEVSQ